MNTLLTRLIPIPVFIALAIVTTSAQAEVMAPVVLAEDLQFAINSSKQVLQAIAAKDVDACRQGTRQAKQYYKILVGDFSDLPSREDIVGMQMDKAMHRFKNSDLVCAPENQAKETQAIEETINFLEKIHFQVNKKH